MFQWWAGEPSLGYVPHGVPHRAVEHATLECRPCHAHGPERCPLGHFRCMREVSPEQVTAAAAALGVARGGDGSADLA